MPYQITGTLKLPDGTPASNVDIDFISQQNYSPLVRDLSNVIRTGNDGRYSINLEYGEYAVRLIYGNANPLYPGKVFVFADTPAGQDLPTLMQAANFTPATPEYIVQIQAWLAEAKAAQTAAAASASAAKTSETNAKSSETKARASELAAEADRAEVAAAKTVVLAAQSDVTTKASQASASASAAAAARDSAAASASTASQKAAAAAASEASAAASATKAETAMSAVVGALIDAGPYNASSGALPTPVMSGAVKLSSIWKVTGNGAAGGIDLGVGDSLVYTARDNSYYKIDNTESVSKVNGKTGVVVLSADDIGASSGELPLPDVWAPLSNDLGMITGYGRQIKVGDHVIGNLVNFERSTTATYIDKSGVLRTAGINEPRFEKEGLLVEGQSTNLATKSDFNNWSVTNPSHCAGISIEYPEFPSAMFGMLTATSKEIVTRAFWLPTVTSKGVGTTYTISVWVYVPESSRVTSVRVGSNDLVQLGTINPVKQGFNRVIHTGEVAEGKTSIRPSVWAYFGSASASEATVGESLFAAGCYQVEELSCASSYIPTNGAAVTRDKEKVSLPGPLNTGAYGRDVTYAAEFNKIGNATSGFFFGVTSNTYGNRKILGQWDDDRAIASNDFVNIKSQQVPPLKGAYAGSFDYDGGVVTLKTPDGLYKSSALCEDRPRVDQVSDRPIILMASNSYTHACFGHIRNFRIWHRALTDNQMRSIS